LLVVAWHYVVLLYPAQRGTMTGKVCALLRGAWTGVDLFFVLSGFLIGSILLRGRENPDYYRNFYTRRASRILPLYFLVLLLAGSLALLTEEFGILRGAFQTPHPWWTFPLLIQNFSMAAQWSFGDKFLSITWSLCIEEQFYLLLPLLLRVCPPRRLPVLLLGLIAAGDGLRHLLVHAFPGRGEFMCYVLLPTRWDPLLLGVLGAWLLHDPQGKRLLEKHQSRLPLLLGGMAVVFAWLTLSARITIMSEFMSRHGYLLVGLFYSALVMTLVTGGIPVLSRWFRWRWLRWLGLVSYGVYLLHQIVHSLVHAWLTGTNGELSSAKAWLATGMSLLITLGLASLSWRHFESRFVALGHRASQPVGRRGADGR
jgi:peptidoglycan/LPS O-acetylase OafA/YrhL